MPRVAPIAPAVVRPSSSAPQRSGAADPFSAILDATTGSGKEETPRPREEPRDARPAAPRGAGADHPRHADRRDAAAADAPPSDDTEIARQDTAATGDAASDLPPPDDGKKDDAPQDAVAAAGVDPAVAPATLGVSVSAIVEAGAVVAAPPAPVTDGAGAAPESGLVAAAAATGPLPAAPPISSVPSMTGMAESSAAAPGSDGRAAQAQAKASAGIAAGSLIADAAQAAAGGAKTEAATEADAASLKTDPAATSKADAAARIATVAADTVAKPMLNLATQPSPQILPGGKDAASAGNVAGDLKAEFAANAAANAAAKVGASGETAKADRPRDSLEQVLAQRLSGATPVSHTNPAVADQTATFTPALHAAGAQVHVQNAAANVGQPVPPTAAAIAVAIAARSKDGANQFQIRLDPPELGRIDVKLDVDKSGQVHTHLTVDRPDTLDLLQRDARGLERALQQAGLKTGEGGLAFSLRQQTPDGFANGRTPAQAGVPAAAPGDDSLRVASSIEHHQWTARLRGGVDIRV